MTTTALRSCLANDLCALALFFKPVDTSNNTGFHHRYHRPDSFSVILCASAPLRLCVSARDLFHSDRRVSENT